MAENIREAFKQLRKKFEQKHGEGKDKPKTKQTPPVEESKPAVKTQCDLKPTPAAPKKPDVVKKPPKPTPKEPIKKDTLKPPVEKKAIWQTQEKTVSSADNRKSSLSDEKLQELQEAFILFDKNRDGMITKEELGAVLYALGQRPTVSEVQALIRSVDIDQSGTIEYDEFVKIFSAKLSIDPEKEMKEVFDIFDQNSDGFICENELYEMLHKLGENITRTEATKMIHEADLNRDGKVDYREFKAILNAR